MKRGLFDLLARRRFLPLFVTQFLGATNDNLFKNALVILIVYRLGAYAGLPPQILVTLAAGIFILPFFLLSATAGQIADRYEKTGLIKLVKLSEIGIAGLAAWSLAANDALFMLIVLFLFGVHSTLFGPLKYAILPEHLAEDELIAGNALIETGTFLAILIGTIVGGLLILTGAGIAVVSTLMLGAAIAGFAVSLFMPRAHPGNRDVVVRANVLRETAAIVAIARRRRDVFLSILGISWFWLVGATYLAQFPAFAKDVLHADEHAVTLMLTVFTVGIGIGSMLCGRLLNGEISARHVPLAALGLSLFALDLYFAAGAVDGGAGPLAPVDAFLRHPGTWRVLFDLLMIAVCGGIYIVPLYAIMQAHSAEAERARTVAANNILNALFMVASAIVSAAMLAAGFTVDEVFLAMAVANLAVAVYVCGLLPDAVLKSVVGWMLRRAYGVRINGLENLPRAGERAVVVVNHVSFLDPVLMAAFMPGKPTFAVNALVADRWWVRPFLRVVEAVRVDRTKPLSTKTLINLVREGRTLVIFPEGRITVTGALMKVYEGPGLIADHAAAPIVPVRVDGPQYTPFSRLGGKVRRRLFPRITITVLPARRFAVPPDLKGRARRQRIGMALYDVMSGMMFETANRERTLFEALLDACRIHGAGATIVQDVTRRPLSYGRLVASALALGRPLARLAAPGEAVGIMLPNAVSTAVTFFALQAYGRVPAMMNFTSGAATLRAACTLARISTIVTARRFVEQARLGVVADALAAEVRLLYLEDLAERLGVVDRLFGMFARPFARRLHRRAGRTPRDPAVILFTSGTEGPPKGVVLSHANILANCHQLAARLTFGPADIAFNALPVFHSFGLTGGMLLPMLSGVRTFLYPSPLHYRIVPELTYDTNATVIFGTDTFLAGYARSASPYDFYSVRYVFGGAEKVRDETRLAWMEKFGLRILEGYGATETAPVIATNTPMHYRAGTVGRILPGIEHRLEPVPGIAEGGRLFVRGPNVMLGYLRADRPGEIQPPPDGWYDTGDIVTIDDAGFVTIVGRAKRFAKVAGEMISLGAIEAEIAALWPDSHHAVVPVADERRGEQLVLVTDRKDASRETLFTRFRERGLGELMVPRTVMTVPRLPLLGSGKVDYAAAQAIAEKRD